MKSLFGALLLGVMVLATGCDDTIPLKMEIDGYVFDQNLTPVQNVTLSDASIYGIETKQGDFYEDEGGSYFRGLGQKSQSSYDLGTTDSDGYIPLTHILRDKDLKLGSSKAPGLFLKQGGRWSVVGLIKVIGNIEAQGLKGLVTVDRTTNALKIIEAKGSDDFNYDGFIKSIDIEATVPSTSSATESSQTSGVQDICVTNPELEACLARERANGEPTQDTEESNTGSIQVSEAYQKYLSKTKVGFVEVWFRRVNSDGRSLNFLDTADLGAQGDIVGTNDSDRSDLDSPDVYGEEVVLRSTGAVQQ